MTPPEIELDPDAKSDWHEITVVAPLPLGLAGALMKLIGSAWPDAVIRPSKKRRFGRDDAFTMLVPPAPAATVDDDRVQEILEDSGGDEVADFLGFAQDDEGKTWMQTTPPEDLCLVLGNVAHQIFTRTEGAVNYVEWGVHTEEGSHYLLTITTEGGKSPNELKVEAEAEAARLRRELAELRGD